MLGKITGRRICSNFHKAAKDLCPEALPEIEIAFKHDRCFWSWVWGGKALFNAYLDCRGRDRDCDCGRVVFSWIIKRIIDTMSWIDRRVKRGLSCWFFTVRIVTRRLIHFGLWTTGVNFRSSRRIREDSLTILLLSTTSSCDVRCNCLDCSRSSADSSDILVALSVTPSHSITIYITMFKAQNYYHKTRSNIFETLCSAVLILQ